MDLQKKILIIDDNIDLLDIMKINFEAAGYTVSTSTNGLNGLVEIMNMKPNVILLDVMMPQMNGFEVLASIRDYSSIHIPIIVCSNISTDEDIKKAHTL
jgi:DNA-binding response OmpR family regulator